MLHRIIQQVSNYLRKTAYDPYKNLSRDILLTPKQPFQAYKVASNYKSHPSFGQVNIEVSPFHPFSGRKSH